jgi:hypothetical protein
MATKKIDVNLKDEIYDLLKLEDELITIDALELILFRNDINFDYSEFENALNQLIEEGKISSKYDKNSTPPRGEEKTIFLKTI